MEWCGEVKSDVSQVYPNKNGATDAMEAFTLTNNISITSKRFSIANQSQQGPRLKWLLGTRFSPPLLSPEILSH